MTKFSWKKNAQRERTISLEIPNRPRTLKYRFFEILPAFISYGVVVTMVLLSFFNPLLASIFLMVVIIALLVRAVGIAFHTITGFNVIKRASKVNWQKRFLELGNAAESFEAYQKSMSKRQFDIIKHVNNLRLISEAEQGHFPLPNDIWHWVIVATYDESIDTLRPTLQAIADSSFDKSRMVIAIAYEERGGEATEKTVHILEKEFKGVFAHFFLVKHPDGLPDEIVGKGANITYAGHWLYDKAAETNLPTKHAIVTTIDADNNVHPSYFSAVAYEYLIRDERKHLSYQPVSMFMNNIWDAPAMMRVVAVGNSFWNVISTMRPHVLRNFASHSQPLAALVEMDFWSKRTIVEDGHQYWRSYFHFNGNYGVIPIRVPIYQDAVLSDTWWNTMKAQFVQVRRWDYGASDVAYVAGHLFTRKRNVPFFDCFAKLVRLIEGHTSLAYSALMVTFGGWLPLIINPDSRRSVIAHQLPTTISFIQTIAMVGIFITILTSLRMLPPRPKSYSRFRSFMMVFQWLLMPVVTILYSSVAAFYSQTRLALGLYMEKFDVTKKVVKNAGQGKNAKI
ncbi:hypothetical protein FWH09_02255 [Candidatus Saccharibacteria bacterium]|nr:hypothetical protein [Candidatus Saccharibacteria bacterium]